MTRRLAVGGALAALGLFYVTNATGYGLFLAVAALCYAVAAMSVVCVTGWAGQLSLAQAALTGLGAFVMGLLTGVDQITGDERLPFAVGLILTPLITAAVAVIIGVPALRIRGINLALLTLGAAYAADTNIFTTDGITGNVEQLNVQRPIFGPFEFVSDRAYLYFVGGITVVAAYCLYNVGRSRFGRAMYAVRDSELAAAVLGLNTATVKLASFALSGAYAGLAGALFAPVVGNVYSVFRTFDVSKSLLLLAIVVLGGLRSVPGALVAGLLYMYMPEFGADHFDPALTQVVAGVGLLVILSIAPEGLIGLHRNVGTLVRRWRRQPAGESPKRGEEVTSVPPGFAGRVAADAGHDGADTEARPAMTRSES